VYSKTTHSVAISVKPAPLEVQSSPQRGVFAFSYTIEIRNEGKETVQLLNRHWVISSGGEPFNEVEGPGVVGMQPILEQGQSFEYSSGAIISDPLGSMHGTYTMRAASGKVFKVEIPQFELVYPHVLH